VNIQVKKSALSTAHVFQTRSLYSVHTEHVGLLDEVNTHPEVPVTDQCGKGFSLIFLGRRENADLTPEVHVVLHSPMHLFQY
jgi:hypothetical protein